MHSILHSMVFLSHRLGNSINIESIECCYCYVLMFHLHQVLLIIFKELSMLKYLKGNLLQMFMGELNKERFLVEEASGLYRNCLLVHVHRELWPYACTPNL
jgi:hypothetical protein